MKFLNLKTEPFGLNINDLSLRAVKIKRRWGKLVPVFFAEKAIPEGIIKGGIICDEKNFIGVLKEMVLEIKERLKTEYVVASLPEEKSFFQIISLPIMPEKDLKETLLSEIESYIPLSIDQIYFDFEKIDPLFNSLDHSDIFVAAAERKLVDSYSACLKEAGLIPVGLQPESIAIVNALVSPKERVFKPLLLLQLDRENTNFIIFVGRSIRFTCAISFSLDKIIEGLMKELDIPQRTAQNILLRYGIENRRKPLHRARLVSKIVKPFLEELIVEVKKYIEFYYEHDFHEHFKSAKQEKIIEKILISGPGAYLPGVDSFLTEKLKITSELGNPWLNFCSGIEKRIPSLIAKEALSFTTALGLALAGMKNSFYF